MIYFEEGEGKGLVVSPSILREWRRFRRVVLADAWGVVM